MIFGESLAAIDVTLAAPFDVGVDEDEGKRSALVVLTERTQSRRLAAECKDAPPRIHRSLMSALGHLETSFARAETVWSTKTGCARAKEVTRVEGERGGERVKEDQ